MRLVIIISQFVIDSDSHVSLNQPNAGRDLMVQTRHGGSVGDEEAGEKEGGTTGAELRLRVSERGRPLVRATNVRAERRKIIPACCCRCPSAVCDRRAPTSEKPPRLLYIAWLFPFKKLEVPFVRSATAVAARGRRRRRRP